MNDAIEDPTRGVLYASVPSEDPAHGNEVVAIDPESGAILWGVYVGSEPGPLAVSDDGSTLYVGLSGAAAVRRVDLETRTAGLEFTLGNDTFSGPRYAGDMVVLPGQPDALAVSMRNVGLSPDFEGVAIFDDGVMRPTATRDHTGARMIEAASATRLYGYNNSSTEFGFRELAIDATGVSETWVVRDLISGFATDIVYYGGEIYATNGAVVDPVGRRLVGTFAANGPLAFEPGTDRVYILHSGTFGSVEALSAFERSTFRGAGTVTLSEGWENARRLFRFGSDGFAILLAGDRFDRTAGRIVFMRAPTLVPPP